MADLATLSVGIETRGVSQAKRELDEFRNTTDKTVVSVDNLDAASRKVDKGVDSMSASVTQVTGKMIEFQRVGGSIGATFGNFNREFSRLPPVLDKTKDALDKTDKEAKKVTNSFGLAGHQVRNFGFQVSDLLVQIASGGGLFRPLIQQGPQAIDALGGVGKATEIAKTAITSIPLAARVAFGAAGFVGIIGGAAAALSSFTRDIARTEARIRALNGAQGQGIIDRSKAGTSGTSLDGGDVNALEELATRNRQALGLLNEDLGTLTASAVKLSTQLDATKEQSRDAISDLTKLLSGTFVTGEQAIRFASAYPQFAGALAKAFDVLPEQLKDVEKSATRVNAVIARSIVESGKAAKDVPNMGSAFEQLGDRIGDAAVAFERLTGLGAKWESFWTNVARGLGVVTNGMNRFAEAAERAHAADRARTASQRDTSLNAGQPAGLGGTSPDYREDPRTGKLIPTSPLVRDPGMRGELTAPTASAAPTVSLAPSSLDPVATEIEKQTGILKGLPTTEFMDQQGEGLTAAAAEQTSTFRSVGQTWVAETKNGFTTYRAVAQAADQGNRAGLSAVERAVMSLGGMLGGMRDAIYQFSSYSGNQGDGSFEDAARMKAIDDNPFDPSAGGNRSLFPNSNLPSLAGQGNQITSVLPEGSSVRGSPGNYGLYYKQAGGTMADPKTLAMLGWSAEDIAAGKRGGGAGNDNTASMMGDFDSVIEALRDKQSGIMDREWRPNAYDNNNPDIFYGNGKQFREQQDGAVAKLQEQIDTLTAIRTNGEKLPGEIAKALTAAMIAAGMTGEQIAAALTKTSSRSPSPTASAGTLTNRRAVGGNTVMWGLA